MVTVEWDPEKVADHTGVTATFGAPLAPGLTLVPDALVGLCWPAVFSVIGSAVTADGFPVVEGLLSLVHLDHAAHLLAPMPKAHALRSRCRAWTVWSTSAFCFSACWWACSR